MSTGASLSEPKLTSKRVTLAERLGCDLLLLDPVEAEPMFPVPSSEADELEVDAGDWKADAKEWGS